MRNVDLSGEFGVAPSSSCDLSHSLGTILPSPFLAFVRHHDFLREFLYRTACFRPAPMGDKATNSS
jgi:hypothetical protein